MVQVSYRDPRPIYEQVRDSLRQQILSGVLSAGDQLPSVRELSSRLAVNPNTIQRAYRELELEGCIHSVRGKGSYVADVANAAAARRRLLMEEFDARVDELLALGCTTQELASRIRNTQGDGGGHGTSN